MCQRALRLFQPLHITCMSAARSRSRTHVPPSNVQAVIVPVLCRTCFVDVSVHSRDAQLSAACFARSPRRALDRTRWARPAQLIPSWRVALRLGLSLVRGEARTTIRARLPALNLERKMRTLPLRRLVSCSVSEILSQRRLRTTPCRKLKCARASYTCGRSVARSVGLGLLLDPHSTHSGSGGQWKTEKTNVHSKSHTDGVNLTAWYYCKNSPINGRLPRTALETQSKSAGSLVLSGACVFTVNDRVRPVQLRRQSTRNSPRRQERIRPARPRVRPYTVSSRPAKSYASDSVRASAPWLRRGHSGA